MNKRVGSGNKVLDWIVIFAAIMLYFKTGDVLSYFAPRSLNEIVGYDVSIFYGYFMALLVEGLALVLHFDRRAQKSTSAHVVKWVALFISAVSQVFDGFIVTNNTVAMSEEMKFLLAYGVPLIPILIVVMLFVIGTLPDLEEESVPFVGVKNMFGGVKRIWVGDNEYYGKNPDVRHITEDLSRQQEIPEDVILHKAHQIARQLIEDSKNGKGSLEDENFFQREREN